MRGHFCFAVLALCLVTSGVSAQQGGVGTGEDGCYFGQCDPPDTDRRDGQGDDRRDSRGDDRRYTPPPPSGPKACVTHFGYCQMSVASNSGSICNCPGLAQGYSAIGIVKDAGDFSQASVPNISSICATQYGVCQMGMQLPRGQSCFCPSYAGPIMGASQ